MKIVVSLLLLFLSHPASGSCNFNWTSQKFNSELSKNEEKAFQSFYNSTPSFAYGKVTKVSPDDARPFVFELTIIHYFKKSFSYPKLTVKAESRPSGIEKDRLWILPLTDLKSATISTGLDCSGAGFSPKQEAVFFSFQQLAGFSKDLGLDQWLTCSESHECTFVQTCSCHRVINMVYLPQFSKWNSLSPKNACKSCDDVEDHSVRYRAICTDMKICGQEERAP